MYSVTTKYGQPPVFFTTVTDRHELNVNGNSLQIKRLVADGCFKTFKLGNNIHCICGAYYPSEDFRLYEVPLNTEFFVLRIDEISHSGNMSKADGKYNHEINANNGQSVLLTSSLEEFTFFAPKNSEIKTFEILMSRIWFFSQLHMEYSYGLLKKYMADKTKKLMADNNQMFRNLFLTIFNEANKEAFDLNYLEQKANLLLGIFFKEISANLHDFRESEKIKISKDEITRLMNVRKYLDTNLPSPTLSSLTKMALMSSTSLKTKFKKMYGSTVFEYFQRMRMERARILLLTHKYSVKQIGHQLGYSNLSNFTIAFKKEFHRLPHELIK